MSELERVLKAVAAVSEKPSQIVLRLPANPGPIYDDLIIALQRVAESIDGQDEEYVVRWLRGRGWKIEK